MEIFNNLGLSQDFLNKNTKRIKNIDLDCHGIDIKFDCGSLVSLSFDGADIFLNINNQDYNIIVNSFNDKYKLKLAIFDHLRECNWLYDNEYKPKKDNSRLKLELMDLYILLQIYYQNTNEVDFDKLKDIRLIRFLEKIKESE